jgi:endoglucanase
LREDFFPLIASAGFRHVRVPVRWSAHAGEAAPYTIDPRFLGRVDWVIKNATDNGLAVVLNMHHYDGIMEHPADHQERFVAMWGQIATHYKDLPASVAFEPLNEPHKQLDAAEWNGLLARTLTVIRETNPTRTVVVGPVGYNNYRELPSLKLPEGSDNIVATFHYYDPFHFTHQGAEWVGAQSDQWKGTTWSGTVKEQDEVRAAFDAAVAWAEQNRIELYLGEFGAYSKADMASRVAWTSFIAKEAERRQIASSYWEFCSGFGIYDAGAKSWNEPLRDAALGK